MVATLSIDGVSACLSRGARQEAVVSSFEKPGPDIVDASMSCQFNYLLDRRATPLSLENARWPLKPEVLADVSLIVDPAAVLILHDLPLSDQQRILPDPAWLGLL